MTSNTIELLTWVAARPRTYTELKVERSGNPPRALVVVTPLGRRVLQD